MDNPHTPEYTEVFLDWWSFLVFAGSLVIGFILGTAKQRWTQEQLQLRVIALEARFTDLEQAVGKDSRSVLVIENELGHIRMTLTEIKNKLETLS